MAEPETKVIEPLSWNDSWQLYHSEGATVGKRAKAMHDLLDHAKNPLAPLLPEQFDILVTMFYGEILDPASEFKKSRVHKRLANEALAIRDAVIGRVKEAGYQHLVDEFFPELARAA